MAKLFSCQSPNQVVEKNISGANEEVQLVKHKVLTSKAHSFNKANKKFLKDFKKNLEELDQLLDDPANSSIRRHRETLEEDETIE
jgi:hypothetical protein